jgi:hypothetical protein
LSVIEFDHLNGTGDQPEQRGLCFALVADHNSGGILLREAKSITESAGAITSAR